MAPFTVLRVLVYKEQSTGGVLEAVMMKQSCLIKEILLIVEQEYFKYHWLQISTSLRISTSIPISLAHSITCHDTMVYI